MTTPPGGWNPYDGPGSTPGPGQPYQQPQPAPYQPEYATSQMPQVPAAPASGPPAWSATQPVTGPPAFGEQIAPPPPKSGRSPVVPVLSGVGALFFIISVVLLVLLLNTGGKLDTTRQALSVSETTVVERDTTIADLNEQVTGLQGDIEELEGKLTASGEDLEYEKEAKAAIEECLVEVEAFLVAFADADQSAVDKAIERIEKECGEAEPYR